ncbi:MAG: 2Fe-2S iron-sulfur cluster-binding protein [Myxococcota bacterium]
MSQRKNELPHAPAGAPATVEFEGRTLSAKVGEPLSVTLLAHGIDIASRSIKYHRPRGAFCMAGTCGQCWLRVDDIPNRAACTTPVHSGMTATRENAFPNADHDLFRATDYAFPSGLDHHKLGTTPLTPLNTIIGSTARQMAGLGTLSEQVPPEAGSVGRIEADALVVGGGPAGLAAATALARAGHGVLLVERRRELGGQLLSGLFAGEPELLGAAGQTSEALAAAQGQIFTHTIALGAYENPQGLEVLLRRHYGLPSERLWVVRPRALVLTTGGYEQAMLFGNHDLPGHYGARALARLTLSRGVSVGARIAILEAEHGTEIAERLERGLSALGLSPLRLRCFGPEAKKIIEAQGNNRIKALRIADRQGKEETVKVDAVASALPLAPAFELPSQAGARIELMPGRGFGVISDRGRTTKKGVFAAGEVAGAPTIQEAFRQGAEVGAAASAWLEEVSR